MITDDYFNGYVVYGNDGVVFSVAPFSPEAGLTVSRPYRKNGVNVRDWLNLCESCAMLNPDPEVYYPLTIGGYEAEFSYDDLQDLARYFRRAGYDNVADVVLDTEPRTYGDDDYCSDMGLFETCVCPYGQIRQVKYKFMARNKNAIAAFLLYAYVDTGLIPYQVELIRRDNGDIAITLDQIDLGLNQYGDGSLCSHATNFFDWVRDTNNSDIPPDFSNGWDYELKGNILCVTPGYVPLEEITIPAGSDMTLDQLLPLDQLLVSDIFLNLLHLGIDHDGRPSPDQRDTYTVVEV